MRHPVVLASEALEHYHQPLETRRKQVFHIDAQYSASGEVNSIRRLLFEFTFICISVKIQSPTDSERSPPTGEKEKIKNWKRQPATNNPEIEDGLEVLELDDKLDPNLPIGPDRNEGKRKNIKA